MPNNEHSLLFTTRVDLSGLEKGLSEAKVSVADAQTSFEDLTTAQLDSERAVDAVMEAFSHFDELLANRIAEEKAYTDQINAAADAYERQLAVRKQIAEQAANEAIAETILAELSKERTAQEINSNNAMRSQYEEMAGRTAFAVESNKEYADSVAGVTAAYRDLVTAQVAATRPVAAPVVVENAQNDVVTPAAAQETTVIGNIESRGEAKAAEEEPRKGAEQTLEAAESVSTTEMANSFAEQSEGWAHKEEAKEKRAEKAEAAESAAPSVAIAEPTHEEISQRAYELWDARGRVDGHQEEDWQRAQQELRAKAVQMAEPAPAPAPAPTQAAPQLPVTAPKPTQAPAPAAQYSSADYVSNISVLRNDEQALESTNRRTAESIDELRNREVELANTERSTTNSINAETRATREQQSATEQLSKDESTLVRNKQQRTDESTATSASRTATTSTVSSKESATADAAAEQADSAAFTAKAQAAQAAQAAVTEEAAATTQATTATSANVSAEERAATATAAWNRVAGQNSQAIQQLSREYYNAKTAGASHVEAMEQAVAAVTANTAATQANNQATAQAAPAKEAAAAATQKETEANTAEVISQERAVAAMAAYDAAAKNKKVNLELMGQAYDKAIAAGRTEVEAMEAAVAAVNAATAANEANTESLTQNTEEENRNAQSTFNRAEAFGTARIGAGLFAGSLTGVEYGLARIAAASRVIGPLLESAMSVAVVAALIDMVVQLGEKIYAAFDLGGEGAYKLQRNIDDLDLDFQKLDDKMTLEILKQEEMQAKLEKKPFQNGLALSLAEAAEQADVLFGKLDTLEKKEAELLRLDISKGGLAPSSWQHFFGEADTKQEQVMAGEHEKWMARAPSIDKQKEEVDSYLTQLHKRRDELQVDQEFKHDLGPASFIPVDHSKEIAALDQMIADGEKENSVIQKQIQLNTELQKTEEDKVNHKGHQKDPNIEKMQHLRDEFSDYQNSIISAEGNFKPGQGASFWAKHLHDFQEYTNQYREVQNEFNRYVQENHRKLEEGYKQEQNAEKRDHNQGVLIDEWVRRTSEDLLHSGERWVAYNKAVEQSTEIQAANKTTIEEVSIQHNHAIGEVTQLGADMQLAAIHTQVYTDKLKMLRAELEFLEQQGKNLHPGDKGYEENQTKQQATRNEIDKTKGQQIAAEITDHGKIEQDIIAPFSRAFKTIDSDFMKAVGNIRNGTESVSRAFGMMGVDIVEQVEDAAMKMVLAWAAQEAKMLILHAVTNKIKVAEDAQAAEESASISKSGAMKEIFVDAKTAAAGAYAALSGIPVVGPELGAVAAATTFAAVMGLAAFDVGGVIPGSGAVPIVGHGGERVLTTGQTATFEKMVNNMDNSSSSNRTTANITYAPTINPYDARGMRGMLQAHADDLVEIVQNGINSGAITPP